MKRTFLLALLLFTIHCSLFTGDASAQSRTNQITRPCSGSTTPAKVSISKAGAIVLTPCSGGTTTVTGLAGPTFTGVITGPRWTASQGTIATSTPFISHTATWDGSGQTFTNIVSDITDTNSAAGSLLMDLQVNLSSKFTVTKAGGVLAGGGVLSSSPTGGVGYTSGAGGAQTQLTSKATTVVSNTITTAVTMNNASLAADTTVAFTFTNSAIVATDTIICTHQSAGASASYVCNAFPGAGSAVVSVRNVTAAPLAEAIVLRITVIKSTSN